MAKTNSQTISIGTASVDLTSANYIKLQLPDGGLEAPTGTPTGQANSLRFLVTSAAAVSAGKLDIILAYAADGTVAANTGVVARFQATITPTTRRRKLDGTASGDYICTVVFDETQTSFIDPLGYGDGVSGPNVYVGSSNLGGLTSMIVEANWTRAI